jgi:broad specificity phosphatase PhoE
VPKKESPKSKSSDLPTIIYMVRHGESEFNRRSILSGHSNPPLTDEGKRQILETKKALSELTIDHVYSSDLDRAIDTVKIISGKSVHSDNRLKNLREKHYGVLEGKHNRFLEGDKRAHLTLDKTAGWEYKHAEGMESDKEMFDRMMPELKIIAEKHPGQTVLVGSHGTAIRVIIQKIEDKHYSEMPSQRFKNGGYIKLIYKDGDFTLDEVTGYN